MKYYALISDECRAEAQRHGFFPETRRLAEKIESDQSVGTWDRYLPTPFIKKVLGSFRVIAELRPIDHDAVVVFRRVDPRGSSSYRDFERDPASIGRSPDDVELRRWLRERASPAPVALPQPSDAEFAYLFQAPNEEFDDVVYEAPEWVDRIARLSPLAIPWIHQVVEQVITDPSRTGTQLASSGDAAVLCRHFPDLRRTLLVAPFFGASRSDEPGVRARYAALLESEKLADHELSRSSRRAYPALVVLDPELWLAVESDESSNLALSPEESEILDSVLRPQEGESCYPLFINGRPGSGKSTILKYLFAWQLLQHYIRTKEDRSTAPPLYLTYSQRLLADARETVRRILRHNAQLKLQGTSLDKEFSQDFAADSFAIFHEYLLSRLPSTVHSQFDRHRRIGFAEFRKLWLRKSAQARQMKDLSPELVWHVLRTYVKGMRDSAGNYCDLAMYADLPEKRRTVTTETFARVFDDVWGGWYGELCREGDFWDDQDLARTILDLDGLELARHPAVLCDEAQDFTRNELDVILRLSLFSRRTVSPHDLRRIPIAFAGDPYQTLNPTGFQWSTAQAGFHEQIVQELDPLGRGHLSFNFKELAFNYRSTKPIVGFVNLIQALRAIVLEIPNLRPQQSWQDEAANVPAVFMADDPQVVSELQRHDELVIVLPCQEGMEADFIANDDTLRSLSETGQPRNFLSSVSAKGLEFSRVVLYKFGEECRKPEYRAMIELLSTGKCESIASEAALPLEYFINRLYVAASRPKRGLFVVDTEAAIEEFWRAPLLRDKSVLLSKVPRAKDNGWQPEDLSIPQPGFAESWSQDRDNPEQMGQQFMEQGLATGDAYLLSLAAANFRRAGNLRQATLCEAQQNEFAEDFRKAGQLYLEYGDTAKALQCWWRGENDELIAEQFGAVESLEVRASRFLVRTQHDPADLSQFLDFLGHELAGPRRHSILSDRRWKRIAERLVVLLAEERDELQNPKIILAQLLGLRTAGLSFAQSAAFAHLAFAAEDYPLAIQIWESLDKTARESREYRVAKAHAEPFPESISYLASLREYERIVAEAEQYPTRLLKREHVEAVIRSFVAVGRAHDAVAFAERQGSSAGLGLALVRQLAGAQGDTSTVAAAARIHVRLLTRAGNWDDAIRMWSEFSSQSDRIAVAREMVFTASSAEGGSLPIRKREQIGSFFTQYVEQETEWDDLLLRVTGSAVERLGTITNSLDFYEAVWKLRHLPASPALVREAQIRWCRCKFRMADRFVSQARNADATQQRLEAERMMASLQVRLTDIPEFPVLDRRPSPASGRASGAEGSVDGATLEQRDAVRALSNDGWDHLRIAAALRLDPKLVTQILSDAAINVVNTRGQD